MGKEIKFSSMDEYNNSLYNNNFTYWINEGRPNVWVKVEEFSSNDSVYEVEVNVAFGGMRLLENNVVVISGLGNTIAFADIVVLNKEYYGLSKYVWR